MHDAANERRWFAGRKIATETDLPTAFGGTKSGIARAIGKFVRGAVLITKGGLDTDASGWAPYNAGSAISWDAGRLKIAITSGVPIQVGYTAASSAENNRVLAYRNDLVSILRAPIGSNAGEFSL
jgi:hypothetical protein